MRLLQQYAEVIVITCVALSLVLGGALYWIFNYAKPSDVVVTLEPTVQIAPSSPSIVTTPAQGDAPPAAP